MTAAADEHLTAVQLRVRRAATREALPDLADQVEELAARVETLETESPA